jgi:DNA-binding MarR family transcriptional regulator
MKGAWLREAEMLSGLFSDLIERVLVTDVLVGLADADVTPAQIQALHFLARHERNRVGDLTVGLGISYPAATKTVDRLVARGLIDRREGVQDRRLSELTVTERGERLLGEVLARRRERLDAILARMAPDDQRALLKGLKGFLTAGFMVDKELIAATCQHCGADCYQDCVVNQSHLAFHGTAIAPV